MTEYLLDVTKIHFFILAGRAGFVVKRTFNKFNRHLVGLALSIDNRIWIRSKEKYLVNRNNYELEQCFQITQKV